jgi:hypothetical protein
VVDTDPPSYRKLAGRVAETIRQANPTGAMVLIGHSGAGALLPATAEATATPVAAVVFVDAILPHPGVSWFETAPPVLREQLRGLASDGQLPAWHQWFPPEVVTELLPEEDLRRRFIAELPVFPWPISRNAPRWSAAGLRRAAAICGSAGPTTGWPMRPSGTAGWWSVSLPITWRC